MDDSGWASRSRFDITGGAGNDTCNIVIAGGYQYGSRDTVSVFGDDGANSINIDVTTDSGYGATVSNTARGGSDDDTIQARAGVYCYGWPGGADARNELFGDEGDDRITAIASATSYRASLSVAFNTLDGGIGNDTLTGEITADSDAGSSRLYGGAGADQLTVILGDANVLDGGAGDDISDRKRQRRHLCPARRRRHRHRDQFPERDRYVQSRWPRFWRPHIQRGWRHFDDYGRGEALAIVQGVVGLSSDDFDGAPIPILGTSGDNSLPVRTVTTSSRPLVGGQLVDGFDGNDLIKGGNGNDPSTAGPAPIPFTATLGAAAHIWIGLRTPSTAATAPTC